MELAGVEKRAVPAAHVDHRARELPEVHPVHHLPAAEARPVAHRPRWLSPPLAATIGAGPAVCDSRSAHNRSKTSASTQTPSHAPHSRSGVEPISTRWSSPRQPGQRAGPSPSRRRTLAAPHLWQKAAPSNPSAKQDGQLTVASRAWQYGQRPGVRLGRRAAVGAMQVRPRLRRHGRYIMLNANSLQRSSKTSTSHSFTLQLRIHFTHSAPASALQRGTYGPDGLHQRRADRRHRVDRRFARHALVPLSRR